MKFDNIVFRMTNGGIGKVIASTAVIRAIKKQYPDKKITVICGHPDIYFNNKHVERFFGYQDIPKYFYEDYFDNSRTLWMESEPYLHPDYIDKTKHLVECWCEQLNVPFDGIQPEICLTSKEKKNAETFLKSNKKPLMLIQIEGGAIPLPGQMSPKMYTRGIPMDVMQDVVDKLKDNYRIMQVKAPTQPGLKGVEYTHPPESAQPQAGCNTQGQPKLMMYMIREVIAFIPFAEKIICNDSFIQHACAGLGKKAIVLWGGTSPKVLGHESNKNLTKEECPKPFCHRPNSYVMPDRFDCPYGEPCMNYTVDEILNAIKE